MNSTTRPPLTEEQRQAIRQAAETHLADIDAATKVQQQAIDAAKAAFVKALDKSEKVYEAAVAEATAVGACLAHPQVSCPDSQRHNRLWKVTA